MRRRRWGYRIRRHRMAVAAEWCAWNVAALERAEGRTDVRDPAYTLWSECPVSLRCLPPVYMQHCYVSLLCPLFAAQFVPDSPIVPPWPRARPDWFSTRTHPWLSSLACRGSDRAYKARDHKRVAEQQHKDGDIKVIVLWEEGGRTCRNERRAEKGDGVNGV